jgi:hypothetical protein
MLARDILVAASVTVCKQQNQNAQRQQIKV